MKLTLAEPKYLKDSISIISELVTEASFKITSNGIELIAMDPASVAMVVFKLLNSAFVEYEIKDTIELSINLNNLKQILKRAKPNDTVTLEMNDNDKLKIQFKSNTTRTFNLPIIELEEKEQKIPQLDFKAIINIDSNVLNEAIEDVDIVAESVLFEASKNRISFIAEGDLSKANIDVEQRDGDTSTLVELKDVEKASAKYSIEYLKKMMNGSKLSDKVTLYFSDNYPLKLEYKAIDKVMLWFVLAPRVDND